MTTLVCASDTHSQNLLTKWHWPDGDILVHAGDMSARGSPESIKKVGRELSQLPYRYIVVVAGNHDRCFWENAKQGYYQYLLPGIIILQDETIELLGLRIYGSSWLKFKHGVYPFEVQDLKEKWELIPDDTDVLVTHMPPKGMLDVNGKGESKGSGSLRNAVRDRVRPKLHVFGHIHDGYGLYVEDNTTYVNAALTGDDRKPLNMPVVVQIQPRKQ